MRHLCLLLILVLLLAACGAPYVQIQRAEFSIMYADIKSQVSVWMFRVEQGCQQKKLSASTCSDLPNIRFGLTLLDEQAKDVLRQADKEPDWAKITKYAELAIGLAMKAAAF
jgi:hypothetical protein